MLALSLLWQLNVTIVFSQNINLMIDT